MGKSRAIMLAAAIAALPIFTLAGCPKKNEPAKPAKTEAAKQAAEPEPLPVPEKPPVDTPSPLKDIMTPLCERMLTEYKVAQGGKEVPENLAKAIIADCRVQALSYKGSSKAKEATTAYAEYLTKACLTKAGQEWIDCFNNEQPAAGSAANKIIMGK